MRTNWSMSNSLKARQANNALQFRRLRLVPTTDRTQLGIDRETVGRYLRLAETAISTSGLEEADETKPAIFDRRA
jgi:hypothetical protein